MSAAWMGLWYMRLSYRVEVQVFWDVTYDRVLESCLSLGGGHRHHLQRLILFFGWQNLSLEAVRFSETPRIILTPGNPLIFVCIDDRIPKLAVMIPLTSHLLPDVFQWLRDNALVAFYHLLHTGIVRTKQSSLQPLSWPTNTAHDATCYTRLIVSVNDLCSWNAWI
jgi:hypothetical protein